MATFNVNVTFDNPAKDKEAATLIVEKENERRQQVNDGLDEGETPLPMLPMSNDAELRSSYETVLGEQTLPDAHGNYAKQRSRQQAAKQNVLELWDKATSAQRQAMIQAAKT